MISHVSMKTLSGTKKKLGNECCEEADYSKEKKRSTQGELETEGCERFPKGVFSLLFLRIYSFVSFWFVWVIWLGALCRTVIKRMVTLWLVGGYLLPSNNLKMRSYSKHTSRKDSITEYGGLQNLSLLCSRRKKVVGSKEMQRCGMGESGMDGGKLHPSASGASPNNDGASMSRQYAPSAPVLQTPPSSQGSSRGGPSFIPSTGRKNVVPRYFEYFEVLVYRHFLFAFLVLYVFVLRDRIGLLLGRNPLTVECTGFLFWQLLTEEFDVEGNGDVSTLYSTTRMKKKGNSSLDMECGRINYVDIDACSSPMVAFLNHHKYPPHYVATMSLQSRQACEDSTPPPLTSFGRTSSTSGTTASEDVKDKSHLLQLFYNLQHASMFSFEHIVTFFLLLHYVPFKMLSIISACTFALHTARSSYYSCFEMVLGVVITATIASYKAESSLHQWSSMPIDPLYITFVVGMSIALSLKEWTPVVRQAVCSQDMSVLFRRPISLAKAWEEMLPSRLLFGRLIPLRSKLLISDILYIFHPVTDRGSFVGIVWCYGLIVAEWAVGMRTMGMLCIMLISVWWWISSFCVEWIPFKLEDDISKPMSNVNSNQSMPGKSYSSIENRSDPSEAKDREDNLFVPNDTVTPEVERLLRRIVPLIQVLSLIGGFALSTSINSVVAVWLSNSFKALVPLLFIHRRKLMNMQNKNASLHLLGSELKNAKKLLNTSRGLSNSTKARNHRNRNKSGRVKERSHNRQEAPQSIADSNENISSSAQLERSMLTCSLKPSLIRAARFCTQYTILLIFYEWLTFDTPYGFISRKEYDVVDLYYRTGGRGVPPHEWYTRESTLPPYVSPTPTRMNGKQFSSLPGQSLVHFSPNLIFSWLAPTPQNLRYVETSLLIFVVLSETARWIFLYCSTAFSPSRLPPLSRESENVGTATMSEDCTKPHSKENVLASTGLASTSIRRGSSDIVAPSANSTINEETYAVNKSVTHLEAKEHTKSTPALLAADHLSFGSSAGSQSSTFSVRSASTSSPRAVSLSSVEAPTQKPESKLVILKEVKPMQEEQPDANEKVPMIVSTPLQRNVLDGNKISNKEGIDAKESKSKRRPQPDSQGHLEENPVRGLKTSKESDLDMVKVSESDGTKKPEQTKVELISSERIGEVNQPPVTMRSGGNAEEGSKKGKNERKKKVVAKTEEANPKRISPSAHDKEQKRALLSKAEQSRETSLPISNKRSTMTSGKTTESSAVDPLNRTQPTLSFPRKVDSELEKVKSNLPSLSSTIPIPLPRSKAGLSEKAKDGTCSPLFYNGVQQIETKNVLQNEQGSPAPLPTAVGKNQLQPVKDKEKLLNGKLDSGEVGGSCKETISVPLPKSKQLKRLAKPLQEPTLKPTSPSVLTIDDDEKTRLLQELVEDVKQDLLPERDDFCGASSNINTSVVEDCIDHDGGWIVREVLNDDHESRTEPFMRCETTNSFSLSAMGNMSCCFSTAAPNPGTFLSAGKAVERSLSFGPIGEENNAEVSMPSAYRVKGEESGECVHRTDEAYSQYEPPYRSPPVSVASAALPSDGVLLNTSAANNVVQQMAHHFEAVDMPENAFHKFKRPESLSSRSSLGHPSPGGRLLQQEDVQRIPIVGMEHPSNRSPSGWESGFPVNASPLEGVDSRPTQPLATPLPPPPLFPSGVNWTTPQQFVGNTEYGSTEHQWLSPYRTPPPPPSPPLSNAGFGSSNGNGSPQPVHYSNPPAPAQPAPHATLIQPALYSSPQAYTGESMWYRGSTLPSLPTQFVAPISYTPVYVQTANVVGVPPPPIKIMATQDPSGAIVYQQVPADQLPESSPIYVMLPSVPHVGNNMTPSSSSIVNYSGQPIMYSASNASSPIAILNHSQHFASSSNAVVTDPQNE